MFNFDFSNVSINQSPRSAGVFQVKITSMEPYESQTGNARIRIKGTVDEGESKGCSINDGINLPMEEAADYIATACTGLIGYCYYAPAVDDKSWPTRKWVTADQYTASQEVSNGKGKSDDALGEFMSF